MVERNSLITLDDIVYKVEQSGDEKYVSVNEIISADETVTIPSSIEYEGETFRVDSIRLREKGYRSVETVSYTSCSKITHNGMEPYYKENTTLKHITLAGNIQVWTDLENVFKSLHSVEYKTPMLSSIKQVMGDLIPVTRHIKGELMFVNKNDISRIFIIENERKRFSYPSRSPEFFLLFSGLRLLMKDGSSINIVEDIKTIQKYIINDNA